MMKRNRDDLIAAAAAINRVLREETRKVVLEMHRQGVSTHYMEDGKCIEERPDGSRHEIALPVPSLYSP